MNFKLCLSCYFLFLFLYSLIIIAIEATSFIVGLIFLILPLLCFLLLSFISIPKSSEWTIDDILGKDFWQTERNKRSTLNENEEEKLDDSFCIKTIAHRACGLDAPENSIAAMKLCKQKGCKFIEIDLCLTADNIPIVFHDYLLDRMTNGTGYVKDKTFEETRRLSLTFRPDTDSQHNFSDEKIPTFEECIEFCLEEDMRLIIDIKDSSDEVAKIVTDTFKRHPQLYTMAIVSSFNGVILYKIRSKDPKIVCSVAWRPKYFSRTKYDSLHSSKRRYTALHLHYYAIFMDIATTWLLNHILYHVIGISAILIHKDCISGEVVTNWQKKGVRVMAWTVNSKTEKDYFCNNLKITYLTDTMEYSH